MKDSLKRLLPAIVDFNRILQDAFESATRAIQTQLDNEVWKQIFGVGHNDLTTSELKVKSKDD